MELINIFLDACAIIYWVESAEPFYSKFTLQLGSIAEKYPQHVLTVSRLSFLECLVKPIRENNKVIIAMYQKFFEMSELNIVELDQKVVDMATQLRARYNLRTPDALQAASCFSTGENHIFLTNDKRFDTVKSLKSFMVFQDE